MNNNIECTVCTYKILGEKTSWCKLLAIINTTLMMCKTRQEMQPFKLEYTFF